MTFRETKAHIKAKRIRKAIAKTYAKYPDRAVDHVNGALEDASRGEERRYNFLTGIL